MQQRDKKILRPKATSSRFNLRYLLAAVNFPKPQLDAYRSGSPFGCFINLAINSHRAIKPKAKCHTVANLMNTIQ